MYRIETIPLVVNAICTAYYLYQGAELGKLLYWVGATILTVGILIMRG